MISTFAIHVSRYISVAFLASPVVFSSATFTVCVLGVVEVTVVATPPSLLVTTFAGPILGNPSPILLIGTSSASLHGISSGIAHMAGSACPVVFFVATFARPIRFYINFTVFIMPPHQD